KMKRIEQLRIPRELNYDEVVGLSSEGREKLKKIMPNTLGQASRISGVTPSDLQVLWMYLETRERNIAS
ncbi:MAG: tRNA uridine-5-carboxymethylaminomethyl(34) synthesis enzyme MnmG, partial [Acetomicrobium sp.]